MAHGKRQDTDGEEEDEEGVHDKENDKFLNRLTDGLKHQQNTQSSEKLASAKSHEEWARRKEHEMKLKEKLIQEAKRDLAEKMLHNYMEGEQRKEQR